MKTNHYQMDMTQGPILRKMLVFSLPLMLTSILQLLFNAADIVVVGRFSGDTALAAVGSTGSIINLIVTLFMGLSVGVNVVAARDYGAGDDEALQKTVHTSVTLGLAGGALLSVVGVLCAGWFLALMQTPEDVLPLATTYMRIYFAGMTANMVYNFGSAILRSIGDTRRPLYFLTAAGIINVILNLFFVIVLRMGVAGVAIATVISQTISAVLVILCLVREKGAIRLDLRKLTIHRDIMLRVLKVGLPAGFQGVLFSLSNVVIQSSINLFGSVTVAGNSAAANIEGFVYVAENAFYQATISFVSQNYGAKKYDRINRILLTGELCVLVIGTALGNLATAFGVALLGIYTASAQVIAAGLVRMRFNCSLHALCGMMDTMVGGLRGIGYSVMPMIVSLMGACGVRLLWIATVFQLPEYHTASAVYASYPLSWGITFLCHLGCYLWAKRRLDRHIAAQERAAALLAEQRAAKEALQ